MASPSNIPQSSASASAPNPPQRTVYLIIKSQSSSSIKPSYSISCTASNPSQPPHSSLHSLTLPSPHNATVTLTPSSTTRGAVEVVNIWAVSFSAAQDTLETQVSALEEEAKNVGETVRHSTRNNEDHQVIGRGLILGEEGDQTDVGWHVYWDIEEVRLPG
ncbi:hypothetical protein BU26DRAFT_565830 [Trematosphaeria pertusa]|uniref:Uncharacterized protein n=1 Tax=Trematosphaeria pertusa TaxID=390896 RepID=A0A6A6IDC9_9PLEO|nr:uncharacterized protein BU26DRAFT_565830 [Trematosphaeria pertusa]KAF2248436.1 hypothetical protein BU26DRAFT_565830 [Trematosphaeria pertusa]